MNRLGHDMTILKTYQFLIVETFGHLEHNILLWSLRIITVEKVTVHFRMCPTRSSSLDLDVQKTIATVKTKLIKR